MVPQGKYSSSSDPNHHQREEAVLNQLQAKLSMKPPWPSHCCIFRVPSSIRQHNDLAYDPQLVSIGPYHHGRRNLRDMDKLKLWYLTCLLDRAPTPETTLRCLFKVIRNDINHLRDCYAESADIETDEFIEMMVLDGCFIVELFRKKAGLVFRHQDDPIFTTSYMHKILLTDLLLLENQLPWHVLESLFYTTASNQEKDGNYISLASLALNFFDFNTIRTGSINPTLLPKKIKHLLDLQRNNLLSSSHMNTEPEQTSWYPVPCVSKLLQAGIKFEMGESKEMMDVEFSNGILRIPPIMILDNAGSFIRNLIAYEQCDVGCKDKITSYAILLSNLVETGKDLEYLCQKGIVTCYLSSEEICNSLKRVYSDVNVVYYSYAKLSGDVNRYCRARWPRWRATLLRDYFNNPWSIISFLAAIVFLFLGMMQTLYTVFSYGKG